MLVVSDWDYVVKTLKTIGAGGLFDLALGELLKAEAQPAVERPRLQAAFVFLPPPEKLGMFNYRPHCLSVIFNGDVGTRKSISNVRIKFIAVRLVVYSSC